MKFTESFDQHKLNYVLQNKEKFTCRIYEVDYDPFNTPTKYLQKSTNGEIKVSYHQPGSRNFGRFFADGSVSLQNICREIRHTIASEYYDDLDVVNCHPVILRHLCKQHDIICDRLNDYIEDRDKHIEEIIKDNKIERDDVKTIFLSLINGGHDDYKKLENPTPFIRRFKRETTDILEEICDKYPNEYELRKKSNPTNPMGSTINAIMCEFENKILQCILKFYQDKKIIKDNCVLCFDGIMIPKHADTEGLITECEAYITEKCGLKVSIKIKLMDQGFTLPNVVPAYVEYVPFDPRDEFCWLEFDEKYRGRVFTSLEEVIEQTRVDLNRVLCKVEQGSGVVVKKTDCKDNLMEILDVRTTNDLYFKYIDNDKPKEMSFKRYIQVFSNSMNRYRSIDFAPGNTDPRLFNLWSGFVGEIVDGMEDIASIQLILAHIKDVYCNGCEVSYEYFLDLIYYILKYPGKPLGVATFIYSNKQGSGKNIILDFLQEFVFGNNISYYTTGLETVLEKHNHLLKNKKVVIVDELASSSDNFIGNFDRLKSMMTGPFLSINPKNQNQFNIRNVLAWFLISNHEDCIRMEPSDRRFFCLNVSEKYVGDKTYFKKLADTFSKETGNAFFTYIMNRGDNKEVNIKIPPMNAFKKHIISHSWSTSVRYLFDIKDKEYEEYDETEIKASDLFSNYADWCHMNRQKVKSSNKFYNDIKNHITKEKKRTGVYYDLKTITMS